MKNEYDALNRAAVRPEEYAPVPLSGAQQKAQLERLLAGARTKGSAPHTHTGEGPAPAQSRPGARGARRGRKRMAALRRAPLHGAEILQPFWALKSRSRPFWAN